jgi:hypothetical protein
MATRSTIAIQNADGSVTGIYCHWDGYFGHNGRILQEHYNTEERVRELLALGHLSSLGEELGEKHPFDTYRIPEEKQDPRWKNWCKAFGRDRDEKGQGARTEVSWRAWLTEQRQQYNYLFVPGSGWAVTTSYYWQGSLEKALADETIED